MFVATKSLFADVQKIYGVEESAAAPDAGRGTGAAVQRRWLVLPDGQFRQV